MTLVHQTKSEFVADTLAKYGFGKRKSSERSRPKPQEFEKPEKSIHQITSERFYQQARDYIIKQQEGA